MVQSKELKTFKEIKKGEIGKCFCMLAMAKIFLEFFSTFTLNGIAISAQCSAPITYEYVSR